MTRINANIDPSFLIDQHLIAEYREILRIPNIILKKGFNPKNYYPPKFVLGIGHVLYFYDKIKFLHKRFLKLKNEMDKRCIVNNIDDSSFQHFINDKLYNDIVDEDLIEANKLVIDRIILRISEMKNKALIYKKIIDKEEYFNLLRKNYN